MSVILSEAPNAAYSTEDDGPLLALVAADSAGDRRDAGSIIERTTDMNVVFAGDGAEALEIVGRDSPALVLTDLLMPNLDGIALVNAMKNKRPEIPVIVMTADGSEDAAAEAMRAGAVNYIPKRYMRQELPPILAQVLAAARTDRRRYELMSSLAYFESRFVLDNDPTLVPVLVAHLQEHAERMRICNRNGKIRLGVALEEALLNGLYHGNLEVSSDLKRDNDNAFHRLAARRRLQEPYASRKLHVDAAISHQEAKFVIRDEGAGFDISKVPDPTDPENLLLPSGRGLMLIRLFTDVAVHNAAGNELTIIKRRSEA